MKYNVVVISNTCSTFIVISTLIHENECNKHNDGLPAVKSWTGRRSLSGSW